MAGEALVQHKSVCDHGSRETRFGKCKRTWSVQAQQYETLHFTAIEHSQKPARYLIKITPKQNFEGDKNPAVAGVCAFSQGTQIFFFQTELNLLYRMTLELTFEKEKKYITSSCGCTRAMPRNTKFSKVCFILDLLYQITLELTF